MATHDYIISNASGAAVRADLNNALAAIVSNNSNATSPATTYAFQFWADTTTGQLKIRNAANSAWITLMELDGTMLMENGTVSAPGLAFASDTNTGFFRSAADKINFATGGAERLEIGSSEVVFNDPSNDVDFRVESNGNAHMLFVDAGNDRVGIGASSPATDFHIHSSSGSDNTEILLTNGDTGSTATDGLKIALNSGEGGEIWNYENDYIRFGTNNTERLRIDSSGNLGIGTSSPSELLHIRKDASAVVAIKAQNNNSNGIMEYQAGNDADNWFFGIGSDDAFGISDVTGQAGRRLTITQAGNVGIGTSSPSSLIHGEVSSGAATLTLKSTATSGEASVSITGENSSGTARTGIFKYDNSDLFRLGTSAACALRFETNDAERMRIKSDGSIGFRDGSTANSNSSERFYYAGGHTYIARNGGTVAYFNRNTNDGTIIEFRQNDSSEGTISVSGSTVSYNGAHLSRWSQLAGGAERTEILRGSVLSNLDEMCEWAHAAQDAVLYTKEDELPEGANVGDIKTPAVEAYTEDNEQLNRMKVSDVEGDVNVAGVFQSWDDDDDTYDNDFYCAMTGDFVIRIAQGTTVARGDLLMSAGDGTAKPQDDDIVRSKTIAKVTSTTVSTTYSDGSYCVPCVLMAC